MGVETMGVGTTKSVETNPLSADVMVAMMGEAGVTIPGTPGIGRVGTAGIGTAGVDSGGIPGIGGPAATGFALAKAANEHAMNDSKVV